MDKEIKDPIDMEQEVVQGDNKEETNEEILVEDGQGLGEEVTSSESDENGQVNIDEAEPAFQIKALENKLKDQEEAILRLNAEYANFRRRTAE